MSQDESSRNVQLSVGGDVGGNIVTGDNNLTIGEIHGGTVNINAPGKKPVFSPSTRPIDGRPRRFTGLLDRTEELGKTVNALRTPACVSIYGQNGLGKTVFLRHLAYNFPENDFPDGVVYLPARGKAVDDLLQEIFEYFFECDVEAKPTPAELQKLLKNICALIILDDISLSNDQVQELINKARQCVFIFASTERCLWGEGSWIQLQGLPASEAVRLMERELDRSVDGEERRIVEEFCQKVRGNPFHVIQAAKLVRDGRSLAEIGDAVFQSEDALAKSIYDRLTSTQKWIILYLAAAGNFPVSQKHLAALVRDKDLDAQVNELLDQRVIQANSPAYNLTGSLAPSLERVVDLTQAENQVLDYFVQWIVQNPPLPDVTDALNLLLSLMERADRKGRWDQVISIGRGIEKALILAKRWQAWSQVLDWVLKAARAAGDRATQGWALHETGTRHLCLGNLEAALQSLGAALEIRTSLGDQAGAAVTRHNLNLAGAPPVPPRNPPRSGPGPSAMPGGSSVLKIILGLGITGLVVVAGLVAWKIISDVTPTSTPPVVVPPVYTETFTPTVTPTDTPTATGTPMPTSTATETPMSTSTTTPSQTPSSTPTYTPTITLTPAPILLYDFVQTAASAAWQNSQENLYFPGKEDDEQGFAIWRYKTSLEDGSVARVVLETHPAWVANGMIQGYYRLEGFGLQPGDRFTARVGLMSGARAGDVTFRVIINYGSYLDGCGEFGCTLEYKIPDTYDGKIVSWEFTLPREISGKEVYGVYLIVDAGPSSAQDWAVWEIARFERP